MKTPTLADVLRARQVVSRYLPRTPLHHYRRLSEMLNAEVYLKHENHHALGAFKARGGINTMHNLGEEDRRRGVVTASTGNHAQAIAYAGAMLGIKAVIVMPEGSNPSKVAAVQSLGADVVFFGKVFDDARGHAESLEKEYGYRYIHSANEPDLIAGAGTYALEIMEDLPEVEYIFVPLGGGSGASGACIAAKSVNPGVKVIAVQSEQAPGGYLSWKNRKITQAGNATFAEGLATSSGYELTQRILWEMLDDFVLVSDDEIKESILHLVERAHTLAEGAGAAALAGAIKVKETIRDRRVALVVSGGNLSLPQLKEVSGIMG